MDRERFAHCQPPARVKHTRNVPFHPNLTVRRDLRDRIHEIHRLDRELDRFILKEQDYLELVTEAWSSNFHYSTRLEGNPLDLEQVRKVTRNSLRRFPLPLVDAPVQEILNHIMVWVTKEDMGTPWTVDFVREVHAALMTGAEEGSYPGEFRDFESAITNEHDQETFIPAPSGNIEEELEELLRWLNEEGGAMFPAVAAALFFHEFESIHPFVDGNGRTGRVLFHLYLQNHGLPNSHLCMIEQEITGDPELYYRVLGWTDHTGDHTDLVEFFVGAIQNSYQAARERFAQGDLLSGDLGETPKRLLIKAKAHGGWFASTEASAWVEGRADDTVRRHLNGLVEEDVLESRGQTRAKRYRFRNPLKRFKQLSSIMRDARARYPDADWENPPDEVVAYVNERLEAEGISGITLFGPGT